MADDLLEGALAGEEEKSDAASEAPAGAEAFASALAAIASRQDPGVARRTEEFLIQQSELLKLQAQHLRDEHASRLAHLRLTISAAKRKRYADRIRNGLYTCIALIVLGVLVAAVRMTAEAVSDHSLVVENFTVPADVAARGGSGEALAEDLVSRVALIRSVADRGFSRSEEVRAEQTGTLKVQIPETGVSLDELERFLHHWLGRQTVVNGEVRDEADGQISTTLQIEGAAPIEIKGSATTLGDLMQQTAEQAFASLNPVSYGVWLAEEGREAEALQVIRRYARSVQLSASAAERAAAYALLADTEPDPRRALTNALIAIDLDSSMILGLRVNGVVSADLGHDRTMVEFYRRVLDAKPEDQPPALRTGYAFAIAEAHVVVDQALGNFIALDRDYEATQRAMPSDLYASYAQSAATAAALHDERRSLENLTRAFATVPESGTRANGPLSLGPPVPITIGPTDDAVLRMALWYVNAAAGHWTAAQAAAKSLVADAEVRKAAAPDPDFANGFDFRLMTLYRPWLAYAKAMTGDTASAMALIAQTSTDCYLCVRTRGMIAATAGDPAAADRWFADAMSQAPDLPTAYLEWGQALLARGDLAGAAREFTLAHEKGPHFADPLKGLGDVLVRQRQFREALTKYDEALRYAPNWTALRQAREAAARTTSSTATD